VKKVIIISSCLLISAIGLTQQTHVVKRGETLWGISATYLDDPFYWWQVYKANRDQIEDPHWIYPGQIFIIPYLTGELTSTEMGISTAETAKIFAKERPISGEKPIEEEEFESLIAAKKKEVGVWKQVVPVVPPTLVYRAGYITKEPPKWGRIIATEEKGHKSILTHNEVLVDKGSRDGVKEGDLFTVLKIGRGVRHPQTRKYLGKIVHVLGTLRATSVEENSFRGLVEESYESMGLGDLVIHYEKPTIPAGKELLETGRELQGVIVAKLNSERNLLPREIVYVDKGKEDGVHPGDIFEIYREGRKIRGVVEPMRVVGELQVLRVGDETSTAVITSIDNRLDLRVGELIRLKKEAI